MTHEILAENYYERAKYSQTKNLHLNLIIKGNDRLTFSLVVVSYPPSNLNFFDVSSLQS